MPSGSAGSHRTCAVRRAESHREPWQTAAVAGEAADVIGSWCLWRLGGWPGRSDSTRTGLGLLDGDRRGAALVRGVERSSSRAGSRGDQAAPLRSAVLVLSAALQRTSQRRDDGESKNRADEAQLKDSDQRPFDNERV
ncbi:hypothetical protein J3F83DRAFT_727449 [Trichoderma novae-zelandiae]